jgi:single-strand DNA-binding protein
MARSLNRAQILGNLTRDPEMRATPAGQQVTTFGVATNRTWTGQDGTKQERADFHNVVVWGKLAEIASKYLAKGRKVYIEGRLQTRDWTGQDGVKRTRTEIIADNLILVDSQGGGKSEGPFGASMSSPEEPTQQFPPEEEIQLENIPF